MSNDLNALELSQMNALRSEVTGLMDWVKTARRLAGLGLDWPTLQKLYDQVLVVAAPGSTRDRVIAALGVLKSVVTLTPNKTDDMIVGTIESVLTGPALELVSSLIDSWLGNRTLAQSAVEADVTALGLKWSKVFELAQLIFDLIRSNQS